VDEQSAGDRVCDGDLVNVAPFKFREERFWIHALLFATASPYEQTCTTPFPVKPLAPELLE